MVYLHVELKTPIRITSIKINVPSGRDLPGDIEKAVAGLNKLELGQSRCALRNLGDQSVKLSEFHVAPSQGIEVGTRILNCGRFIRDACEYQRMKRAAGIFDFVHAPEMVGGAKAWLTSGMRSPDVSPNRSADDEGDQEQRHAQDEGLVFSNPLARRVPCTRCADCVDQGEEAECYCESKSWYFIPSHARGLNGIRGCYQGTKN